VTAVRFQSLRSRGGCSDPAGRAASLRTAKASQEESCARPGERRGCRSDALRKCAEGAARGLWRGTGPACLTVLQRLACWKIWARKLRKGGSERPPWLPRRLQAAKRGALPLSGFNTAAKLSPSEPSSGFRDGSTPRWLQRTLAGCRRDFPTLMHNPKFSAGIDATSTAGDRCEHAGAPSPTLCSYRTSSQLCQATCVSFVLLQDAYIFYAGTNLRMPCSSLFKP
jgi:hypothetical protein